ncbi:hypothetical protein ES708_30421 [subsurface metagenome]
MSGGGIYDLLDTRYQRGEGGYNHPPRCLGHHLVQRFPHYPLRRGISGQLGVGGIGEQKQYPLRPQLRQPRKVGRLAVHRRIVQLKIPAVDDYAQRGMYNQPGGVGYAVADREQLHPESAQRQLLAIGYRLKLGSVQHLPLLELNRD